MADTNFLTDILSSLVGNGRHISWICADFYYGNLKNSGLFRHCDVRHALCDPSTNSQLLTTADNRHPVQLRTDRQTAQQRLSTNYYLSRPKKYSMNANRFNFGSEQNSNAQSFSLKGKLLVATERLSGSRFEKAVVFMMQDDERGTFGVRLNKPANDRVRKAWTKLTGSDIEDEHSIVAGGPLQGPVFALHQDPDLGDVEMPGGLYVSAQVETLQQLMRQFDNPFRIFVGVAGWKPGQLGAEVQSGHWYELPLDIETVFDDPTWMWEFCLQECGFQQIASLVGEDKIPIDPSLN